MARGVNKVILIGNLGKDPDCRALPSGQSVTNLSVATDESYKDKQTGEMVAKTEWHRVSMFGRLAEIAQLYLKKGSKVYIEGRLQTRKYEKDGQDVYTTDIVANEMQMLDSKSDGDYGSSHSSLDANNPPQRNSSQASNNKTHDSQPQYGPDDWNDPGYVPF